ncbi:MAG: cytidine deaminase [Firmicutes bacterium]|nr:cytidine deaminase [Bacillota bacterium]
MTKGDYHQRLVGAALKAREQAYVPYSMYRVGAAVLTRSGKIYSGCNIENSSYGLTVCAERTAIFKAISEGEQEFKAIAVAVDTEQPATPCGACRQVMSEFFTDNTEIILINTAGHGDITTISQLLPAAFTPRNLNER